MQTYHSAALKNIGKKPRFFLVNGKLPFVPNSGWNTYITGVYIQLSVSQKHVSARRTSLNLTK